MPLLDCAILKACDEYFEEMLADSENPRIWAT